MPGLADWLNQGASAVSEGADREQAPADKQEPQQQDKQDEESKQKDKGWQQLRSSNLSAYKYTKDNRDLGIIFHGGRLYTFHAVAEDVAKGLGEAGSPGSYFNHHIKKRYAFTKGGRAT